MYSWRDKFFMEQLISALPEEKQGALSLNYVHNRMAHEMEQRGEREQLKKEIIDEVLKRIYLEVDTGEAIKEIDSLNKAIEQLAR